MAASGARRSILLLVSSMSAGGRSVRLGPRIVRILRGGGWEVAVRLTTPGDDPAAIAGEVASGSFVAALAASGTSTVSGIDVISRGYEHFTRKLHQLDARVRYLDA